MATDYISREAAIAAVQPKNAPAINKALEMMLNSVPAADVRPVAEISDAVDEVLVFLNANSYQMPYHIYSALFDLVSEICPPTAERI